MNNFLGGLLQSFKRKGKVSARKLTVFVAFILFNIGFIVHLATGNSIQKEYVVIYAIIVLLGLGFLTAENIVELFKGSFGVNDFNNIYTPNYIDTNRVDNPDEEVI
jgi:hypothetical protein